MMDAYFLNFQWATISKAQQYHILMYTEFQELNIVEDNIECVFVKMMGKGNVIIVGIVYRPPNSNIVDFNDTMSNIFR